MMIDIVPEFYSAIPQSKVKVRDLEIFNLKLIFSKLYDGFYF